MCYILAASLFPSSNQDASSHFSWPRKNTSEGPLHQLHMSLWASYGPLTTIFCLRWPAWHTPKPGPFQPRLPPCRMDSLRRPSSLDYFKEGH